MHLNCDKCNLYKQCENFLIPGRGNLIDPLLILIGEAPGRMEDQEGKVFIGPAGEKLSSILKDREADVYITNCCKCAPFFNPLNKKEGVRKPTDSEINYCKYFFLKELKIFDPKKVILVPMGTVAYNSIFGFSPKNGISANVGRIQEVELDGRKFTVIPNFHPAYLLEGRHPEMEPKFVGVLEHAFDMAKNKREGKVIKESSEWEILDPQRAIQEFKRVLDLKDTLGYIYIDLETPSFEIDEKESNSEIIMINFAHSLDYQGYSVPLKVTNHVHHLGYPYDVPMIEWNVSPKEVEQIRRLFSQIVQEIPLVGHVLKFDLKCLRLQKWIPDLSRVRIFDDTSLLTHLVYTQRLGNLKLKDVCRKLFNVEDDWERKVNEYTDLFRLKTDRTYDKIPTGILGEYGALDAFYNKKLHMHLLEKMPEKLRHLRDVMNYLVIVYTEAELAGFPIDQSILDYLSSSYGTMLEGMVEKALTFDEVKSFIRDKTEELKVKYAKKRVQPTQEMLEEESFGMTKLKPLAAVIYGKKYFGMPILKHTKGGKNKDKKSPSTDQEAVNLLLHSSLKENQKKFIENLADFRTISKLKSTYVDPVYAGLKNGIYYWDFIIPGTVTGRLGSGFHTLPHSSDIKLMYSSRHREQGGLICSADFSQLELRILAALAKEYKMIDAFIAGVDIHAKTASEIFHVPIDQVTDDQRQVGKVTNFSIIYGKTAETLKDDLHCTKERAQEVIDNLLVGYDKVSNWIMARYREVAANASVVTAFGREIPIPEWTYDSGVSHLEALRMSTNYPIQSAASDLVKSSIGRFHRKIKKMGMKTIFMGDTHDAIHNDLYPGELFDIVYLMKLTCENESQEMYKDWLICPIRIDVSLGVSIGNEIEFEIKEIEDDRILLVGEGTRRDFNLLMSVGSEAYQMNLSVEKETPIKPEEYSLDRVIRDKVKWEAKLEIKRK